MFRKGDDIFYPVVASNAMMKLVGEGAGSKTYPGIHAGSSEVGSEGKDSGPRAAVTRARWEAQASMQDLPKLARTRLQWKRRTHRRHPSRRRIPWWRIRQPRKARAATQRGGAGQCHVPSRLI